MKRKDEGEEKEGKEEKGIEENELIVRVERFL
jgi:hypothetical protein